MYHFYYRGIEFEKLDNNIIHKSYIIYSDKKYILQEINTGVYSKPLEIMINNLKISEFINNTNEMNTVKYVKNNLGEYITIIECDKKRYFRCFECPEDIKIYELPINEKTCFQVGRVIGKFCCLMTKYNNKENIMDYHNIEICYTKFLESFKENRYFRRKFCLIEGNIAIKNNNCYIELQRLYDKDMIPKRIVSNNAKCNNIIFNQKDEAIGFVNLDNVTFGLMIFDYAEGARICINNIKEDDRNINNMKLKFNMFETYTKGFLESTIEIITTKEINLLIDALEVIVYEYALRYLTDFLDNDIYFRTNYCNHNLIRAKNQLHLFLLIREHKNKLRKIVQKCVLEIIKN